MSSGHPDEVHASREALDMGLLLFKVEPTTGTVLSKKLARNRCGLNFDVPFLDVLRRFFHHAKDFVWSGGRRAIRPSVVRTDDIANPSSLFSLTSSLWRHEEESSRAGTRAKNDILTTSLSPSPTSTSTSIAHLWTVLRLSVVFSTLGLYYIITL